MPGPETTNNTVELKELGNAVLSVEEDAACTAIDEYVKKQNINLMTDEEAKKETLLDQGIQDLIIKNFGKKFDVNKTKDARIDAKEKKENDNFFGFILYDIKSQYDNISKDAKDKNIQEKRLLDLAKTFLLLKGVKDAGGRTNIYRQGMDDKNGEAKYASIEKCLKLELHDNREDISTALWENNNKKNVDEIKKQTGYEVEVQSNKNDLGKYDQTYSINKQFTKEEADAFKIKTNEKYVDINGIQTSISDKYDLQENKIDNRKPAEPIMDNYNLPENIINLDFAAMDNLPGFAELNAKIKNREKYKIKSIDITGMASFIPTDLTPGIRAYLKTKNIIVPENTPENRPGNNDYLAKARALIGEDWVKAKCKENNYKEDEVKITINQNTGVLGDAWDPVKYGNIDDPEIKSSREALYGPFQGVKCNIELDEYDPKYEYTLKSKNIPEIPGEAEYEKFNMEIIIPKALKDAKGEIHYMRGATPNGKSIDGEAKEDLLTGANKSQVAPTTDFMVLHYDSDKRELYTNLGHQTNAGYDGLNTQSSGDASGSKTNVYGYIESQKDNYATPEGKGTDAVYKVGNATNVLLITSYEDYLEYKEKVRENVLTDKQLSEYFETKLENQKNKGMLNVATNAFNLVNTANTYLSEEGQFVYGLNGQKYLIHSEDLQTLKDNRDNPAELEKYTALFVMEGMLATVHDQVGVQNVVDQPKNQDALAKYFDLWNVTTYTKTESNGKQITISQDKSNPKNVQYRVS